MKNKWLKPKMILNELKVIEAPDDIWLTRLRRDHFVWAVKEKRFMKVEWAFEPPEPGCIAGRMGLKFCWKNDQDQWGTEHCQTWFVKENGKGLDDKLLLKPVKDNCPDEPSPISEPWQRHVERQMSVLSHKVEQLESQVNFLEASRSAWRY